MNIDKVKEIIKQQLCLDTMPSPDETLQELGADSLDKVQILLFCEEEFGIAIPDDAWNEIKSVNDIIEYIEKATKSSINTSVAYSHESGIDTMED